MKKCGFIVMCLFLASVSVFAQDKPDALKIYRNGRDLEAAGRIEDAKVMYAKSIEVCLEDLVANPKNMDAFTIQGWALIRLGKYQETVKVCVDALKITPDYRITETLAEAYFYQDNHKESLKNMEKYIDAAPRGERISTAYFFVGEIYRINKQYNKAEIAYSAAVYLEPAISLWWFRLGTVRESVGDKTFAIDAYQRALKLRPDYKAALEGLNRLKT